MKRIISCSDGTWNKPGCKYDGQFVRTNVQKLFEAVCKQDDKGIHQIKYYDEGIGAEGSLWSRMVDGATGKGIDDNIKDAYKFIIWNYEPVDELYIFGFSRGAYTARSLAGLIRNCGILKNNDLRLINEAYDIYRNRNNDSLKPEGDIAEKFREDNSHRNVKIKFIGVWDTVGALGIPARGFQWFNKKKYEFHDTTLSNIVENAFHGLAIDEKRENFAPTLWTKSEHGSAGQQLKQMWFAGVHSNVGGGYPNEGLSDIALQWLAQEAGKIGLGFDKKYLDQNLKPEITGQLYNSRSGVFKFLPPKERAIDLTHNYNAHIHPSVLDKMKSDLSYRPKNLLAVLDRKLSRHYDKTD